MVRARFQLSLLAFGIQFRGAALQVLHNLFRHQMAVLVAALVGLAFDVEINPSSSWIAVGRAKRCHRGTRRPIVFRRNFIDANARKPSLTVECTTLAGCEQDAVLGASGGEAQMDASPVVRATDGFRSHIERHGCHGKRGADGDGRAIQVAHGELVSSNPASQFVALADGERDGSRSNARIPSRTGFQAHRLVVLVGHRRVRNGAATQDGPAVVGVFEGTLKRRGCGERSHDGKTE